MPSNRRAGFTLIELLVALVIFVMVAASLYRVLNVSQQTARTQTEKAAMQGNLRTGLQLAMAELQELWTDQPGPTVGSAITAMSSTSMSYRAMRGMGMTCAPLTTTSVTIRRSSWTGLVAPDNTQGVYVFDQGASEPLESDDSWREATISSVANGTCTDGGAALVLTVSSLGGSVATIVQDNPVRTWQAMQLSRVTTDGRVWLAMGVAGGALTPLAGPLTSTGILIEYEDSDGNATVTPANVKSIILHLYGETDRAVNTFGGTTALISDSMVVRVQLRNGR
jgi:prepilin-type N-terminal cleavage/methylation domain-containing protein